MPLAPNAIPSKFVSLNDMQDFLAMAEATRAATAQEYWRLGALRRMVRPFQFGGNGPTRVLHEETRGSRRDLATLLADMGLLAEAEGLQRRVLEGDRRQLGADDPKTLNSGYQLARVLVELGRRADAQRVLGAIRPGPGGT